MFTQSFAITYDDQISGQIVAEKYMVDKLLGIGSFGKVYQAVNPETEEKVAVKFEPTKQFSMSKKEAQILEYLEKRAIKLGRKPCTPKLIQRTSDKDHNIIVMELMGDNLETYKNNRNNQKIPLEQAVYLTIQMLDQIEFLHKSKFIHRDVKPENFVFGRNENKNRLYMIDFGISKQYFIQNKHIDYKEDKSITGTVRYASTNSQRGIELSRRDDLESLAYVFIYLIKGSLPWSNMEGEDKEKKLQNALQQKMQISVFDLCKDVPLQYAKFLIYARNLGFFDQPDYKYLKSLFLGLITQTPTSLKSNTINTLRKTYSEGHAFKKSNFLKKVQSEDQQNNDQDTQESTQLLRQKTQTDNNHLALDQKLFDSQQVQYDPLLSAKNSIKPKSFAELQQLSKLDESMEIDN